MKCQFVNCPFCEQDYNTASGAKSQSTKPQDIVSNEQAETKCSVFVASTCKKALPKIRLKFW